MKNFIETIINSKVAKICFCMLLAIVFVCVALICNINDRTYGVSEILGIYMSDEERIGFDSVNVLIKTCFLIIEQKDDEVFATVGYIVEDGYYQTKSREMISYSGEVELSKHNIKINNRKGFIKTDNQGKLKININGKTYTRKTK